MFIPLGDIVINVLTPSLNQKLSTTHKIKWEALETVAAFHTPGGNVAEIFKPLSVSSEASLESRLSPCS